MYQFIKEWISEITPLKVWLNEWWSQVFFFSFLSSNKKKIKKNNKKRYNRKREYQVSLQNIVHIHIYTQCQVMQCVFNPRAFWNYPISYYNTMIRIIFDIYIVVDWRQRDILPISAPNLNFLSHRTWMCGELICTWTIKKVKYRDILFFFFFALFIFTQTWKLQGIIASSNAKLREKRATKQTMCN